jgi:hypothetical protein
MLVGLIVHCPKSLGRSLLVIAPCLHQPGQVNVFAGEAT